MDLSSYKRNGVDTETKKELSSIHESIVNTRRNQWFQFKKGIIKYLCQWLVTYT